MTLTVFGYLILPVISITCLQFYFSIVSFEKILRRDSKDTSNTFLDISKFIKNTSLCIIFSILFSVFENVVKHSLLCLIYYFHCPLRSLLPTYQTPRTGRGIQSNAMLQEYPLSTVCILAGIHYKIV